MARPVRAITEQVRGPELESQHSCGKNQSIAWLCAPEPQHWWGGGGAQAGGLLDLAGHQSSSRFIERPQGMKQ